MDCGRTGIKARLHILRFRYALVRLQSGYRTAVELKLYKLTSLFTVQFFTANLYKMQ